MVDYKGISTFLRKTKDRRSFEETIQTKAVNTQNSSKSAIRNFEMFCEETYDRTIEETIAESGSRHRDSL